MFSNLTVGFLLGIGFAAWVYSQMMRSTGNNTKNALTVAAIAGVCAMFLMIALLGMFF